MSASDTDLKPESATWESLPKKLKVLIILLSTISLMVLCWSGWTFTLQSYDHRWILLTIIALFTVPFVVFLPQVEALVSFGEPFIMAIAVIYGTSNCTVAAACYSFMAVLFHEHRNIARYIFNLSVMICGAFLYSSAFHLLKPSFMYRFSDMILPAAAMALVSFLFSATLTATAVQWRHGQSFSMGMIGAYVPLVAIPFISAGSAIFIAGIFAFNTYIPMAAAPAIGIMWAIAKAYQRRLKEKHLSLA